MPEKHLDTYYVRHLYPELTARYYRLFGPVRRVLDVGCGLGSMGLYKPSEAVQVFGVDHDAGALSEARRWEYVSVCDLEDGHLPFPDQAFDAVLAKDVLEHFLRPWRIVNEIQRVLVAGGQVVVSVPMPKPAIVWNDYTHVRGFSRNALRQMLVDAHLEVVHIVQMGSLRGFGRLHLVDWLPVIMNLPVIGYHLAVNYELLARKP